MCYSSSMCSGGWTWAEGPFLSTSFPFCPAASSQCPHEPPSPSRSACRPWLDFWPVTSSSKSRSWTFPLTPPSFSPLLNCLHLHPLPSVRLSSREKPPLPDCLHQHPLSLVGPNATASGFGWAKRSSEMALPHSERDSRCLPLPRRRSLCATPSPVKTSPHSPRAADGTWPQGLALVPWVSASTICQRSELPPPFPCHLTCFFCVYFFLFLWGFFGAI